MGDTNERLNIHDQVLANAMMYLVAARANDTDKRTMMLDVIKDVLPGVNRDHFIMGLMAERAEVLLKASDGKGGLLCMFEAASAVARFAEWRTGLALEARDQAARDAA